LEAAVIFSFRTDPGKIPYPALGFFRPARGDFSCQKTASMTTPRLGFGSAIDTFFVTFFFINSRDGHVPIDF